jgi:hypothetical protein
MDGFTSLLIICYSPEPSCQEISTTAADIIEARVTRSKSQYDEYLNSKVPVEVPSLKLSL